MKKKNRKFLYYLICALIWIVLFAVGSNGLMEAFNQSKWLAVLYYFISMVIFAYKMISCDKKIKETL